MVSDINVAIANPPNRTKRKAEAWSQQQKGVCFVRTKSGGGQRSCKCGSAGSAAPNAAPLRAAAPNPLLRPPSSMVACGSALSVHLSGSSPSCTANAPPPLIPLRPSRPILVSSGGAHSAPLALHSVPSYRQQNSSPAGVLSPPGPPDWPLAEHSPSTLAQGLDSGPSHLGPYPPPFSPFSPGHSLGSPPGPNALQLAPLQNHSGPLAPSHQTTTTTTTTTTHLNLSPITIHSSPPELPSSCMPLVSTIHNRCWQCLRRANTRGVLEMSCI
ncbi:hypothetical protein BIW11_06296 [Tropilaelaps mercedesae]|uniref:Uncharacterized protein n=1 Tax=Tropilaelaps mercedesae TaxID=418985 RepID=A0A1V9XYN3_9ACAR|nr:hypothetical protein BIW11_06296 [Tropilaelaps mercedesae]